MIVLLPDALHDLIGYLGVLKKLPFILHFSLKASVSVQMHCGRNHICMVVICEML